jgi:hypothetical protein
MHGHTIVPESVYIVHMYKDCIQRQINTQKAHHITEGNTIPPPNTHPTESQIMNTISTIQTEQKFLQQFSNTGFSGMKHCGNDINCFPQNLQRREKFSGMFSTTYRSPLPQHIKDNITVKFNEVTN